MTEEDYLRDRVDDQISWYGDKSSYNQDFYKFLTGLEITCSAAIPILIAFWGESFSIKVTAAILGATITASTSFKSLSKFHENWIQYRATSENLKEEKYLYLTRAGIYATSPDPFVDFVNRCETIISHENISWIQLNHSNKKDVPSSKARQQKSSTPRR